LSWPFGSRTDDWVCKIMKGPNSQKKGVLWNHFEVAELDLFYFKMFVVKT
jgi:hypothetical protein